MITKLINIVWSPVWLTYCDHQSGQYRVITSLVNILWPPNWSTSCDQLSSQHRVITYLLNTMCSPNWLTLCNHLSSQHRVITYLLNIVWSHISSTSCDHQSGQYRVMTSLVITISPVSIDLLSIVWQPVSEQCCPVNISWSASIDQHRVITSLFSILRSASFDHLCLIDLVTLVSSPDSGPGCRQMIVQTRAVRREGVGVGGGGKKFPLQDPWCLRQKTQCYEKVRVTGTEVNRELQLPPLAQPIQFALG